MDGPTLPDRTTPTGTTGTSGTSGTTVRRTVPSTLTARTVIVQFARLRWRTFRGALRSKGALKWTVVMGVLASTLFGLVAGIGFAVAGHEVDDRRALFTVAVALLAVVVLAIGVIAGVSQPIDPRVLSTEPISDRHLALGLLVGSAAGPPGLSALLVALGILVGSVGSPTAVVPAALATVGLLLTLLLVSRSTINLLGLLTTRFPRAGQLVIGLVSIVFYGGFQIVPRLLFELDASERRAVADVVQWSPPGQIGAAFGLADQAPVEAFGRVLLGVLWLPLLAWLFSASTRRLIVATRQDGASARGIDDDRTYPIARMAKRLCGPGAVGAVAWRSVRTRVRTPRSALESVTAAGIGFAVVLLPALLLDDPGAGGILGGSAVPITALFMAGNCFGSDGPALSGEMLCGVDTGVLVRGKARSVIVCAAPVAVVGPIAAAAITGEWTYLLGAYLVAASGLLAGAGAAMVQSVHAPIAIPESDNPLASGDTGKGCLAGIILALILLGLTLATLPVTLGLLWAVSRGSILMVTAFAAGSLAIGVAVYEVAVRHAAAAWRRSEPEFFDAIIPTRSSRP